MWQSGYAEDCKSLYTGSIPVIHSIDIEGNICYTENLRSVLYVHIPLYVILRDVGVIRKVRIVYVVYVPKESEGIRKKNEGAERNDRSTVES